VSNPLLPANTSSITIREKALKINFDESIYGSFAEIGAGQEVAAHFFRAGHTSGTIAKTISAYDMKFSDAIYGPEASGRYVCKPRLEKMLRKEFDLCQIRLPNKAPTTRFFAFADTVATINFEGSNQGHGWLGMRFQLVPEGPVNEVIIHIQMHDPEPVLQQETLGLIGINLVYACFFLSHDNEAFIDSLMDNIRPDRLEIDFLRFSGDDFKNVDNRLISLILVRKGMSHATMFGPGGDMLLPADVLYKKNVLLLRGRFRPPTTQNLDMLRMGLKAFKKEVDVEKENMFLMTELTLNNLLRKKGHQIDEKDFLDRADILCAAGQTVMVSNFSEYFRLVHYLSKITKKKKIGFLLGIHNMINIFDEKYYEFLPGGILEAFGRLFGSNVKMYLYPSTRVSKNEITRFDNMPLPDHLKPLHAYLLANNRVENLEFNDEKYLAINSEEVLDMIKDGEDGWEQYVPGVVASIIKKKALFGYIKNAEKAKV
jgi:hypothetical protein